MKCHERASSAETSLNPLFLTVAPWRVFVAQQYCPDSCKFFLTSFSSHAQCVRARVGVCVCVCVWERTEACNTPSQRRDRVVLWVRTDCALCTCHGTSLFEIYRFSKGAPCIILILTCDYLFGNIYNRTMFYQLFKWDQVLSLCFLLQTRFSSIVCVDLLIIVFLYPSFPPPQTGNIQIPNST